MHIFQTIILGIVEGITEFLPISSTGHLILTSKILDIPQTDFLGSFEIAIQLGAILAVVVLYWRKLLLDKQMFLKVLAAFIPTAVIGLVFYKIIKEILLKSDQVVVWSLAVGGLVLVIFEWIHSRKTPEAAGLKEISFKQAIYIGFFQSIAMIPGVSRSAATIIGGLAMGLRRQTIVEFSFLLAVPTMLAATFLDLLKSAVAFSPQEVMSLTVGFFVSFGVAVLSIKFLLFFIKKHNFVSFGFYRILLAITFYLFYIR